MRGLALALVLLAAPAVRADSPDDDDDTSTQTDDAKAADDAKPADAPVKLVKPEKPHDALDDESARMAAFWDEVDLLYTRTQDLLASVAANPER